VAERTAPGDPQSGAAAEQRVAPYILFRLVLAFALLGLAVVLGQALERPGIDVHVVSRLGAVAFVFMGLSAALTPRLGGHLWFRWSQVLFDMALFTVLVALSGGPQSPFFTLYFLNIAGALWLLPAGGAVLVALGDVVLFGLLTLLGAAGVIPLAAPISATNIYSEVLLRVFALMLVALLSTQLAANLRRQLAEQQATARRLTSEQDAVLTQVPAGVLLIDREGRVQRMNQLGAELLGPVLGRALGEVLQVDGDRWEQDVDGPSGRHRVLCGRKRIGRGEQVLILEDVTRLREMEEERQRDERLAAVGRLAAGLAHEIRNPLASLSGAVQLLRSTPDDPLPGIALREVRRLSSLVDDFLDASSPLRLEMGPVDAAGLVDEVLTMFRQDPRFQGRVRLAGGPQAPAVLHADGRRLRQVVWNLLLNAAQAIPEEGEVRVSSELSGDSWRLRVADDGTGIDEANLSRVFDPFFTTRVGGTGLGLAAVYRIVTAHGGTVSAESRPGLGTTFTAVLPRVAGPPGSGAGDGG
jgi:two-component system, NtrC family, sensor histidine kinase PilS